MKLVKQNSFKSFSKIQMIGRKARSLSTRRKFRENDGTTGSIPSRVSVMQRP